MWMRVMMVAVLAGCGSDACELASERLGCDDCFDGEVTCSLDGVSVTAGSCGDCQARRALEQALCDAGSTVSRAEIEADEVCEDPVP